MFWGCKQFRGALTLALMAAWAAGSASAPAQNTVESVPQTTEDALHAMEQQAAVIFVGQVTAVRRRDGANGATGVVEIEFAVMDAVRGVSGNNYTLREWAGLWSGGDQPLRAGQCYLMLLHAPSASGLSSPVGGADGAIPVREYAQSGTTRAVLTRVAGAAPGPHASGTVDLRWIATRVARPETDAASSPVHPTAFPSGVRANVLAAAAQPEPAPTTSSSNSGADGVAAAESAEYATVLTWLRSWVKTDHVAR